MLKRFFDVFFSALGILLLSPLLLLFSAMIKLSSAGPVFYRQLRVGRGLRPFSILKFRTMVVDADKTGPALTIGHDPRITPIGQFLRRHKLDELPQLFNVLAGDMSFVGPRPEVPKYVDMFRAEFEQVLSVRPGVTDRASILFRNESEVLGSYSDPETAYCQKILPQKLALNLEYVRDHSLLGDVLIVIETLKILVRL